MDEPGTVSLFVNLGNDREKPTVFGRKSRFYLYWTMANGGPPRKHETMNYDIFLDKCFWARIEDCSKDSEGRKKLGEEKYSRIVDLEGLIMLSKISNSRSQPTLSLQVKFSKDFLYTMKPILQEQERIRRESQFQPVPNLFPSTTRNGSRPCCDRYLARIRPHRISPAPSSSQLIAWDGQGSFQSAVSITRPQ